MTDKELNIALREMARESGICDQWYNEWKDEDTIDMCLDRAIVGFDFVQRNDYPPLDFVRRNIRKEDLHRHNIYVDENIDFKASESGFYVFMGDCKGRFIVDNFMAVTVYLRHNSNVDVEVRNGSVAFVTIYDNSESECTCDESSTVKIYDRKTTNNNQLYGK